VVLNILFYEIVINFLEDPPGWVWWIGLTAASYPLRASASE
jgi:hypothetical protein